MWNRVRLRDFTFIRKHSYIHITCRTGVLADSPTSFHSQHTIVYRNGQQLGKPVICLRIWLLNTYSATMTAWNPVSRNTCLSILTWHFEGSSTRCQIFWLLWIKLDMRHWETSLKNNQTKQTSKHTQSKCSLAVHPLNCPPYLCASPVIPAKTLQHFSAGKIL